MKTEFFEESGSDFLTTDPINLNAQQPQVVVDIPALHKMEEMPNPVQMADISKRVDSVVMKEESIDDRIKKDIQSMQTKMNPLPKSPLDKLKKLISVGTLVKQVELFGLKFELRALDQSDLVSALDAADTLASGSGRTPAIKLTVITYAIESLDNVSIYKWFPDIKLEDFGNNKLAYAQAVRQALRRYLEPMPDIVIDKLYEEYRIIEKDRDQALAEIKNS